MEKELEILQIADYYEKFGVGDATAYLMVNKQMTDHQCMFGFVSLPNDLQIAQELFSQIEEKAASLGYKEIVGPINYTTWLSYRWTISNFEQKLYPDCDNPPYYPEIIKELGYKELYTYRSASIKIDNKLYLLGKAALKEKEKEGYRFCFVSGDQISDKIKDVYDVSVDAFAGSQLYSDIPYEAFQKVYMEWVRKVDVAAFIAYKDEKAVGFVMGYKNPFADNFISKTSAVLKEYRNNKVYAALLYLGSEYVKELGYDEMFYHFQCEQKKTFKRFNKNIESNEKRYAVFIKELQA